MLNYKHLDIRNELKVVEHRDALGNRKIFLGYDDTLLLRYRKISEKLFSILNDKTHTSSIYFKYIKLKDQIEQWK